MTETLNPEAGARRRRRSRAVRWVALLALAAGFGGCSRGPEVPGIEGWTGEPQVAAKIEEARREAIDNPDSADAIARLGMVFQAHELDDEAIACYDRATELAPEEPRWPYLAALSVRKEDPQAAVERLERAAELGMQHAAFHVNFGDLLSRLGRSQGAEEQYRLALERNPQVTHALYGLAQLALTRGEPDAAREHLEHAAGIAPWHGEVRTLLAQTYQRLGRPDDAERELKAAGAFPEASQAADPIFEEVEAEAVTSVAYTTRARRLAREGRYAEAEALYRKVMEIRPPKAGDYSNLGGTLAGQGRLDEAIELYERALELDDDDPYALNNLAMALARTGEPGRAVELLERALAIEPTYPEAHHNLGLVLAGQRRFSEAAGHYRRALEQNPSLAAAHNDLGTALAALGDLDGAAEEWRQALQIDSRQLGALYNLAIVLIQRGEHQEAMRRLEAGLAIAPNSSRLVSLLAWELATAPDTELRDPARAEQMARRVYDAYPNQPQPGDVLAAALAAQGRFDEAATVAEAALAEARRLGQRGLAAQVAFRLKLYQRQRAFVQGPQPGQGAVGR